MVDPSSGQVPLLQSIRQAEGTSKAKLCSVMEHKVDKKKEKEQEQGEGTLLHPLQEDSEKRATSSNHHQTPTGCSLPLTCEKACPLLSPGCLMVTPGGYPNILVSAAWAVGSFWVLEPAEWNFAV